MTAASAIPSTNIDSQFNRLIYEKSPYLLQHARNPVDWYPWNEKAFIKARAEHKPIFLSIGYSTCHWCHVMAHESFEDQEVARFLNEHFVSIKVDREERPDVDRLYMTFVQVTTGDGGWPMSVWLTPSLKPFYGGTYFPPEDRWGRTGFMNLLKQIDKAWQQNPERLTEAGEEIIQRLRTAAISPKTRATENYSALLKQGTREIKGSYDPEHGGFGEGPKFPNPANLNFLLSYYARTQDKEALDMTLTTLQKMALGGIHDHLGGGFHRYTVDTTWHVPHFEKMLYDQAQLACCYLNAYLITHEPCYATTARDTLDYVIRDMTGAEGQFFSAEDADSPLADNPETHAEGAFYIWEHDEIVPTLGEETARVFNFYYGIEPKGNVRHDPHGEFRHKNIPIVRHTLAETATTLGGTVEEITATLAQARSLLSSHRAQRPRPHRDDKALTAWNGLMISAFAQAYQTLDDPRYLNAAKRSAAFVMAQLHDVKSGKLRRHYRDGAAATEGFAEDYAFLIQGLLDLYEAAFDETLLVQAITLQKKQNELFWDKDNGGYFNTTGQDASVLLRLKDDHDGAEPAANSVAALNLLRLAQMTDDETFRETAARTLSAFAGHLERFPSAMPQMLLAFSFDMTAPKQIVIAGQPGAADTRAMLAVVRGRFRPNKTVMLADGAAGQRRLAELHGFLASLQMLEGQATAYVCENNVCALPVTTAQDLAKVL